MTSKSVVAVSQGGRLAGGSMRKTPKALTRARNFNRDMIVCKLCAE